MKTVRFLFWIDHISTWSGKASSWIILLLTGAVCVEVVKRYALNAPTSWIFSADYMMYGTMFTNYFVGQSKPTEVQAQEILDIVFHGILTRPERRRRGVEE